MSVLWSALFGYLFLCAFVLDDPRHGRGRQAGLERVLLGLRPAREPRSSRARLSRRLRRPVPLRPGDSDVGLAHDFAFARDGGLPGSKALSKVSPKFRTPVAAIWTGAVLSVLFVWGTTLVSIAGTTAYTIVVSCTVIFLFLSFTVPIALGSSPWGTPKWDRMGPWDIGGGIYTLFAVLSILSMT